MKQQIVQIAIRRVNFLRWLLLACMLLVTCFLLRGYARGHDGQADEGADVPGENIIGDWSFRPDYRLPGRANWSPLSLPPTGISQHARLEPATPAVLLDGELPTQRVQGLLAPQKLPSGPFTIELWINDHVNQPVGCTVFAGDSRYPGEQGWTLTYQSTDEQRGLTFFSMGQAGAEDPVELSYAPPKDSGFLEYWRHVVVVFDSTQARLYINGKLGASVPCGPIAYGENPRFEIAGYLKQEPWMELANLLHSTRLYDVSLSEAQIQSRYGQLCDQVERGIVVPDEFHFSAGPYLNYATTSSINVVWETDRPAKAEIHWGTTAELGQQAELTTAREIQKYRIEELEPHTAYFYRILAKDAEGAALDSGILTFQTAVQKDSPFKFAVIGDTETRPHINNRVAQLVWKERPNFVINLGDLTDGGMKGKKFQWNLEYFTGIGSLGSRVPFFPVPGNGESDLYWYNKYHMLPGEGSPYSFRFGSAEFFMLDSNRMATEFLPGSKQYQWLDEQLAKSAATWKFVCLHFAPYTSDDDDYGDTWKGTSTWGDLGTRPLVPLFEKHKVDIVMFGHLHSYERTLPLRDDKVSKNGVTYILSGGAGGNLEDFAPNVAYFSHVTYSGHHYCMVRIHDRRLELTAIDIEGRIRDQMTIDKSTAAQK